MSTSVKVATPKDAFVVHSKSDKMHAALVNLLGATLASFGRSFWEYSDWDWEATRKGAFRYYWSGSINEFDPARHMAAEAPFRRREKFAEVDNESLHELLQTSPSARRIVVDTSGFAARPQVIGLSTVRIPSQ
ncbi:MAG TPA: hypothetical protein VM166_11525 [Gemmatimonadaceae bacterium]|nr:hypothetical protein [Gemmatimonadaceae bacterium]